MFLSEWFERRKFKYLGYLEGEVHYLPLWGFPECTKNKAVHLFENGNGKRKVTGDSALVELPEIEAWLNGASLAAYMKTHLKGVA